MASRIVFLPPQAVEVGLHGSTDSQVLELGRVTAPEREVGNTKLQVVSTLGHVESYAEATRMVASTYGDGHPAVSPDGQRLAFVSNRSGAPELWTSATDGSGASKLTSFDGPYLSAPRFSPDGRTLVFDTRVEAQADIYSIDAQGGPRDDSRTKATMSKRRRFLATAALSTSRPTDPAAGKVGNPL